MANKSSMFVDSSGSDFHSCGEPSYEEEKENKQVLSSNDKPTNRPTNPGMSKNVASSLSCSGASVSKTDETMSNDDVDCRRASHTKIVAPPRLQHNVEKMDFDPHRATPKQIFPHISCLPFENNVVFCFVLSAWDNIVGPQTVYVWKKKSLPSQKNFDDLVAIEKLRDHEMRRLHRSYSLGENLMVSDTVELNDSSSSSKSISNLKNNENSSENDKINKNMRNSPFPHDESLNFSDNSCENYPHRNNGKADNKKRPPSIAIDAVNEKDNSNENQRRVSLAMEVTVDKKMLALSLNDAVDNASSIIQVQEATTSMRNETHDKKCNSNHDKNEGKSFNNRVPCADDVLLQEENLLKERSKLHLNIVVKYVTEHIVGVGELGHSAEKLTTSLLVVPHHSIIVLTARFKVVEEGVSMPYCLSVVIPLEEEEYFIPLVEFTTNSLLRAAAMARLLITKHGLEGGGYIKFKLLELCEILVALRKASLDQYPLSPAGKPPEDRRLAEFLLTSHLQTMGTTLVVADSPNAANKVVMWLGQFSRPEDHHISRLCLSFSQWPFHPGLAIQGVVRDYSGDFNVSSKNLLVSSRPLTVVDLSRGTVRQTLNALTNNKLATFRQELVSLWHDLPNLGAPSQSLFYPVKTAAPLVKKFLHDYDRLGSCNPEVQQNFITSFLRSLQYTALALITWTEQEWIPKKKQSIFSSLKQALMSVFVMEAADLQLILAQAEFIQPGFYSYVMSF